MTKKSINSFGNYLWMLVQRIRLYLVPSSSWSNNHCTMSQHSKLLLAGWIVSGRGIKLFGIQYAKKSKVLEIVASWKEKLLNNSLLCSWRHLQWEQKWSFYCAFLIKTQCLCVEKCKGGKISKDRLTTFVCGDLEKPLVIEKQKT